MKRVTVAGAVVALAAWTPPLVGQSYDPVRESPHVLLAGPKDPLAYRTAKATIDSLLRQRQYARAETLAEQITRDYPRDGENWLLLGNSKEGLRKFADAATANERAGALLGWGLTEVPFLRAARNHLAAGNKRAALDHLRREVFERGTVLRSELYDVEDFVALRSDPEFLEIVGRVDSFGWSRDDGWRHDIDFLRAEVKRTSPDSRNGSLPAEFERRYADLRRDVPQLSDEAIFVGMGRLLAVLRQGHTELFAGGANTRIPTKRLPLQLWVFPEGIFVVDAIPQHREFIGSRLMRVEGVPAEEVLRRVNATQSVEGDSEYLLLGTQRMRTIAYLKGLGIARSYDSVRLTVQRPGHAEREVFVGTPPSDFSLSLGVPPGLGSPPLIYRDKKQHHWDTTLAAYDARYVQLNGIHPDPDETLPQYGQRLRKEWEQSAPKNLIIDLRHNGGGSTHSYPEFLRSVIGLSQRSGRRVYVLIGRNVYSAASNLITDLERLAAPVFVGEATSGCCSLYGDPADFTLPFSRVTGRASTVKWNLSWNVFDGRREMSPHVPVVLSARDYFAGRDPVMETVLRMISEDAVRR